MNLFYIRHHYLSIKRSKTLSGETFAFVILTLLVGNSIVLSFPMLDDFAGSVSTFFGYQEVQEHDFILTYLLFDLMIRLVIRRPLPRLKYYVLLNPNASSIAWQYLLTSLVGIIPYLFGITMIAVAVKTYVWMQFPAMLAVIFWWLANHYLGLSAQYSKPTRWGIGVAVAMILASHYLIPWLSLATIWTNPVIGAMMLLLACGYAYRLIKESIEIREIKAEKQRFKIWDSFPAIRFKNPLIQLELALVTRNKRTRSNLLLGLVSVLLLPFLIDDSDDFSALVFFITTGFFIIQHGVYSLGWEGSYFDFLITNISPKKFIQTRYLFYFFTCVLGLILSSIPVFVQELNWLNLFMIFLYNVGVTIPLVLFRSTLNDSKIVLSENSFMNYNGMMTGPIFLTSFLIMSIPMFIYGLGIMLLSESPFLLFGIAGGAGLLLIRPVIHFISAKYYRKKYHLSQSFKA